MIIDAHQHFWDPADDPYPWMSGPAARLRRVFAPEDLRPELEAAGVESTILVQTRPSLAETQSFLALAASIPFIAGVVGWVDLQDPAVTDTLATLQAGIGGRYLVGIRHQVHDEPDPDWLLRPLVQRGLRAVASRGLVYDLLLRPREIPAAITTVQRLPALRFIVDHLAKPEIGQGRHQTWADSIQGFRAHREHVWCKLSGMITEADWTNWTTEELAPYVATTLDVFGPDRCLFGSDWPVCTLAGTYRQVLDVICSNIEPKLHPRIFRKSAIELYQLPFLT